MLKRPLALAPIAVAMALLLLTYGCSRPVAPPPVDPGPGPDVLQWRISNFVPEGVDPCVPLIEVRGSHVIMNLPNLPVYRVLDVEIEDETVVVQTSLRVYTRRSNMDGWMALLETANLVVLEVEGLEARGIDKVRIMGEEGHTIAPALSLAAAIATAEEHASTDFGHPPPFWSISLDLTYDPARLVYYLGYEDSQTIDRSGLNAVAGTFILDAATGEVVDINLSIVPLGSTRELASGCRLLGWTESSDVLTLSGSTLLTYDVQSRLVHSSDTKLDFSGLQFIAVAGSSAWFMGPQGCLVADPVAGQVRTSSECPETGTPPGTKSQEYSDKTATITLRLRWVPPLSSYKRWKTGPAKGPNLPLPSLVAGCRRKLIPRRWDTTLCLTSGL